MLFKDRETSTQFYRLVFMSHDSHALGSPPVPPTGAGSLVTAATRSRRCCWHLPRETQDVLTGSEDTVPSGSDDDRRFSTDRWKVARRTARAQEESEGCRITNCSEIDSFFAETFLRHYKKGSIRSDRGCRTERQAMSGIRYKLSALVTFGANLPDSEKNKQK